MSTISARRHRSPSNKTRSQMKFFRYRRPSLNTVLGITKAKKRIKRELGITALLKPFRWWPNLKRRIKRVVGYESAAGRLIRNGLPRPGGCLLVLFGGIMLIGGAVWVSCRPADHLPHTNRRMVSAFSASASGSVAIIAQPVAKSSPTRR